MRHDLASSVASIIEARSVRRSFDAGRVEALRGVDLSIAAGEFAAVQGPSGCGKSTLLSIIGALDAPSSGEVLFRGTALHRLGDQAAFRSRTVGFVFQGSCLLPTLTAIENVQIPMFETSQSASERRQRAEVLLEAVGLGDRRDHLPRMLSGGERQRVAIARSLANDPQLLLADEPTGNLDSDSAGRVLALLKAIHSQRGVTLVMVTHDASIASQADRVVHLMDGRVVSERARQSSVA